MSFKATITACLVSALAGFAVGYYTGGEYIRRVFMRLNRRLTDEEIRKYQERISGRSESMGKYIIELERGETAYKTVDSNGTPLIQLLAPIPYTAPDLEQVRKEAYEEGKKQAKVQAELDVCHDIEKVAKVNYQQGHNDAWEAVRKIIHMPEADLLNLFTECYSAVCTSVQVFLKYDASEAIEKIRQYEQEKEEIKVGDEVEVVSGKAVVIYVDKHKVRYVYSNGVYAFDYIDKVTKTGRHFPEVAAVLEKMRESE